MEPYILTYINIFLFILSFKGEYPFPSYNRKFEKYPPYPPLRESEGQPGTLCGRLSAGGRLFRLVVQQGLHLFAGAIHHPIVGFPHR